VVAAVSAAMGMLLPLENAGGTPDATVVRNAGDAPATTVDQYRARSWFSLLAFWTANEISAPLGLIWLRPALRCSLCSCAMAPMLNAAKAIATAAATFASMDNFIWRIARRLCVLGTRLQKEFSRSATEIKRSHALKQERIMLALGCPGQQSTGVPEPFNKSDAVCFHIALKYI
jgi:predicted TIM-barrel enzyme